MEEINIVRCPLDSVKEHLKSYANIFIIHDRNVAGLVERLGLPVKGTLAIEATESRKTLETVLEIGRWLLKEGADRDAFILGVGGGITTDTAGFAASVYKRGVRFGFIPTTLLAQVDAAIGGKNGVNLDSYKNIIGAIRQPEMTFICPETLETLPPEHLLSGAAELIKTFIIDNEGGNYEKAVSLFRNIHTRGQADSSRWPSSGAALKELVCAAAGIKAGIAGRDPYEKGERRLLNLGHTFAHSIEKNSGESIPHGMAVSMGIIMAGRLAEALGLAENGLAARLEADFRICGLPVESPFDIETLADAMKKDKKAEGTTVHFVLPLGIGKVETRDLSVEDAVNALKA